MDNDSKDNSHQTQLNENEIAVITGGASGIGKGIALKCASKEFNTIILVDINKKTLDITASKLRSQHPKTTLISFTKDITKKENLEYIVNVLRNKYDISAITHLFNNAGVADGKAKLILNSKENTDRLHRMMNINFWSHVYVTQIFLPLLLKYKDKQTYIINTVSLSAQKQSEDIYCITKHALAAYTETIYNELKDTNVNVFCLCPGNVDTFFIKNSAILFNDYETDAQYKEKVDAYQKQWLQPGELVKDVTDKIFDAIESKEKIFWINTNESATKHYATHRYQSMMNGVYLEP